MFPSLRLRWFKHPTCLPACLVSLSCVIGLGCVERNPEASVLTDDTRPIESVEMDEQLETMLKSDSLDGWELTNFGGEGECSVKNGVLSVEMGYPLSGVTSTREELPTTDYEVALEAKRVDGVDFFCGLTFPVGESHCSLIVGGWAGAVVGLSCIDGQDAARNETKRIMKFDDDRWYRIRVRVSEQVQAWIDDELVVDLDRADREFTVRAETRLCRPLGLCTFETSAQYRNMTLKLLKTPDSGSSE